MPAGHELTCAFFLLLLDAGLLFTHWIADSLTLWKSPETQSDARLWTAASYYAILSRVPPGLLYVYSGVALLGGATLFWSLGDLRAGNLMFDGGSICECSSCSCALRYGLMRDGSAVLVRSRHISLLGPPK